jgi:hypothetical protein
VRSESYYTTKSAACQEMRGTFIFFAAGGTDKTQAFGGAARRGKKSLPPDGAGMQKIPGGLLANRHPSDSRLTEQC